MGLDGAGACTIRSQASQLSYARNTARSKDAGGFFWFLRVLPGRLVGDSLGLMMERQ
jgi:hypothetical protein